MPGEVASLSDGSGMMKSSVKPESGRVFDTLNVFQQ